MCWFYKYPHFYAINVKSSRSQLHTNEQQHNKCPLFLLFRGVFVLLGKINNVAETIEKMTRKCPICTHTFDLACFYAAHKQMDFFVV